MTEDQQSGFEMLGRVLQKSGVTPERQGELLELARQFPGVLTLLNLYRDMGKTISSIRLTGKEATFELMEKVCAVTCGGGDYCSSIVDPVNRPGLFGSSCESFHTIRSDHALSLSLGLLLPGEEQKQTWGTRVSDLVRYTNVHGQLAYLIGIKTAGWRESPAGHTSYDLEITVYTVSNGQDFSRLALQQYGGGNLRLHFEAGTRGDDQALVNQVDKGNIRLNTGTVLAIQALTPSLHEFEKNTVDGLATSLGIESSEGIMVGTGTLGNINFQYWLTLVYQTHYVGHWQVEYETVPVCRTMRIIFARGEGADLEKVDLFYARKLHEKNWWNKAPVEMQFNGIDATVGGAKRLLSAVNTAWKERPESLTHQPGLNVTVTYKN